MRIAFASYEYPLETGGGGIGTYLETVSAALQQKGHSVVVFAGTSAPNAHWESNFVFRVPSNDWVSFDTNLLPHFRALHSEDPFDVLEGTDFQAAGLSIKKAFPSLPTVVRLHTPLYLVDRLMYQPPTLLARLRYAFGALRRLKWPRPLPVIDADNYYREFEFIKLADCISSPSQSIATELLALGFEFPKSLELVPLVFDAAPYSWIAARENINTAPHVVFIGRLEHRKGVVDLASAIPELIKQLPDARFTFVGKAAASPIRGLNMTEFLQQKLATNKSSVMFAGHVDRNTMMHYLADGDLFVFPSHYESFGLACCEAMASGKAVIGSRSGGMSEIIEEGTSGLLVAPKRPNEIVAAIIHLVQNPVLRLRIGQKARQRVTSYLSLNSVVEKQLACYRSTIQSMALIE